MATISGVLGIMMLSGFMWVPRFCFSSEGALSRPQNLRVEVLDFHAKVVWESGPGNPNNTTYVLELQKFGEQNWTKIENCMTMTTCDLDDFESYDDLMKSYFVRVKAVWVNVSSEWANQSTFQPYSDSLFSPPILNVMVQEGSIIADVQHPVTRKVKELEFAIYLYRNVSGETKKLAPNITSQGVHHYHNLPPDHYCLRAQMYNFQKDHLFAEECVVIHPHTAGEWTPVTVALGVPFLLGLPVMLVLIFVSCYLWPRPNYLRTPRPLMMSGKMERPNLLEVDPENSSTMEILLLMCDNTNDWMPKGNNDNTSLTSDHKGDFTCTRDTSSVRHEGEIFLPPKEEEDDPGTCTNSLRLSANYRLASDSGDEDTKLEESPLPAATFPNDTNDENEGNECSNEYMERLMVGAQWQVHVPSNSSNRQPVRSLESLVSPEQDTAETPSDYIPRPPICYHSDEDSY